MATTSDSFRGLLEGLDACLELSRAPARLSTRDERVSAWSVHEQVEHLLLADRGIVKWIFRALEEAEPAGRAGEPTDVGRAILDAGAIPRGRGPAPDGTIPRGATPPELVDQLEALRELCGGMEARLEAIAASRQTRPHHVLGHFTPAEWLRFLHVHHLHHAAIIDDILA